MQPVKIEVVIIVTFKCMPFIFVIKISFLSAFIPFLFSQQHVSTYTDIREVKQRK